MRHYLAIFTLVFVLVMGLSAQTVTVDASNGSPNGTSTFNSLQAAIVSFATGGTNAGNAAADVIDVVAGPVVDEAIIADVQGLTAGQDLFTLTEDLTIQGSGGSAIVALRQSGYGDSTVGGPDCGFVWRQNVDLTIQDIVFIPSQTDTPTDDALFFHQPAAAVDIVVNLTNVVVTANDGSDAPLTLDGQGAPDTTGATLFGDDPIDVISQTEGGSITLNATNMILSPANGDGMVCFMRGATNDIINCFVNIGEGCVISNIGRFGIQNSYGPHINIQGTETNPVILNNIVADTVWCNSDASGSTQASVLTANNVIVNNAGSGFKEQETRNRGFVGNVTNTRIANCDYPGIELYAAGALDPGGFAASTVNVTNVTVFNCGSAWDGTATTYDDRGGCIYSPIYNSTNSSNRNVTMSNVILAGNGLTGLYNSGTGAMSISDSAIVTNGSHALAAASAGPSTITVDASVINDEIVFLNISNPFAPNFLAVRVLLGDSSPYRDSGPAGGPLDGGGELVEITITGVNDYSLYN